MAPQRTNMQWVEVENGEVSVKARNAVLKARKMSFLLRILERYSDKLESWRVNGERIAANVVKIAANAATIAGRVETMKGDADVAVDALKAATAAGFAAEFAVNAM